MNPRLFLPGLLLILMATMLFASSPAFSAGVPGTMPAKKATQEKVDLTGKSPQETKDILAAMTDEQVREVLLDTLRREAEAKKNAPEHKTFAEFLHTVRERITFLQKRIVFVFSGAAQAPSFLPQTLRKINPDNVSAPLWRLFYGLALVILIWIGGRLLLRRLTCGVRARVENAPTGAGGIYKFLRTVFQSMLELIFIMVTILIIIGVFFIFFDATALGRPLLIVMVLSLLFLDLLLLFCRTLLQPWAPRLRLLPVKDDAAIHIYKLMWLVGLEITLGMLIGGIMQVYNSSEALYLLVLSGTGLLVVFTISIVAMWRSREVATRLRETLPEGTMRHNLANSWHVLLIGYLLFFWLFWMAHLVAFGSTAMLPGLLTLLAFPLYLSFTIIIDKLVIMAADVAKSSLLPPNTEASSPEKDFLMDEQGKPLNAGCPVSRFRRFMHKALSVVLFVLFLLSLGRIWNIRLPLASRAAQGAFSVLITVILGYIFWAFCKAAIERKLRSQPGGGGDEPGMGSGNRLKTLLALLQRFIFVALLVVVTLIVLSSLGVDTGPLLAGASVFGIAIGFGSQTLVKDIVSGIFFLMDDAFRIGDYIELGDSRGTVEGISIRSLKLRHHRGALYTIPYGSIKMVMNLSRDWAIMKLEYMVPHDTDVQKVKAIVKRINKEIKAMPELAEFMLGDIKSQGVKTIEDYGMRMRIKMTTTPGGQFTLRKWIWGKLRRYFDEAGIQFATRKVSVALPEGGKIDRETLEAAAAAASQATEQGGK